LGAYAFLVSAALLAPVRAGIVAGDSMAPTFHTGQLYTFSPLLRTPARGDVVVLQVGRRTLLKRVLATGGDTVLLLRWPGDGAVELVNQGMVQRLERVLDRPDSLMAMRLERLRIPEGQLFVVGDHLQNSEDSRQWGPVPVSAVRGTVLFAAPPGRDWERLARLPG